MSTNKRVEREICSMYLTFCFNETKHLCICFLYWKICFCSTD